MVSLTEFRDPSSEYRIKPFWFWNSLLSRDELLEQIEAMHERGIGGFFIHARFGLETEYLSDEWLELVKACVQKAAELSMEVWIYDENPFPSGIGGLKVSSQIRYRNRYVECVKFPLTRGENRLDVGNGEIIAVRCISDSSIRPLHYKPGTGNELLIEHSESDPATAFVYVKRVLESERGKHFGIDYMNSAAVAEFIEITHEKYRQHLHEHFGRTIKGFFIDEPTLLPWHQDLAWYIIRGDGYVVAWNDDIPDALRDRYGYSVDEVLDAIFIGQGDGSRKIRRDFWSLVADLYEKNLFAAYESWCHKHGVRFTGHVLLEEGLYFNTVFQGNIMRDLEHMDMPGTDHLTNTAEQPGVEFMVGTAPHLPRVRTNVQGQKLVASAAHLSGKTAVISESFGLGGWGMTLQDMRWITNWQYSLGINRMCPHAFFYSIEGFRKLDAPPCHMHNLSWRFFRSYADYAARASYLLSQGSHKAEVAVLYPLSEFQSVYTVGVQQDMDKQISDSFDLACSYLLKLHRDYDIMSEHHLLDAMVSDGALILHSEAFKLLVVPTLGWLSEECLKKIGEFEQAGGAVLFLTSREGIDRIRRCLGLSSDSQFSWVDTGNLDGGEGADALGRSLQAYLEGSLEPDVRISGRDSDRIYYHHRSTDDEDLYFFANSSNCTTVRAHISLNATGRAVIYDCETGDVSDFMGISECVGRTEFDHSFGPGTALAVGILRAQTRARAERRLCLETREAEPRIISTLPVDGWDFRLGSLNALPLSSWQFSIKTGGMGSSYRYETTLEIEEGVEDLQLMLDDIEYREAFMGSMDLRVWVNGTRAKGPTGWHIDKKFHTYEIGDFVSKGANTIRITVNHSAWSGSPRVLTSTPVLLGKFCVRESQGRQRIEKPSTQISLGSWADQGYPYLSGSAIYSNEFTLDESCSRVILRLGDVREYVEVLVNESNAGNLAWQPWTLDITPYVRQGRNQVSLKVTNTLLNMLERNKKPSGVLGPVSVAGYS